MQFTPNQLQELTAIAVCVMFSLGFYMFGGGAR